MDPNFEAVLRAVSLNVKVMIQPKKKSRADEIGRLAEKAGINMFVAVPFESFFR